MPDSLHDVHIPALLYHHVGEAAPGAWPQLTISPAAFRRQMRWLARLHYTPIRVPDLLDWKRGARPLPPRPVLLTFDDAYDDLSLHAFPALQQHGFTATVFVVTGHLGGINEWDVAAGRPHRRLMNAASIRKWAAEGIDFGAHSRSHPDLRHCTEAQLQQEVAGSAADLERLLGKPVLSFAYPFGHHDERVRAKVMRSFAAAFTSDNGLNDSTTDVFALRRATVGPEWPTINHFFRLFRGGNVPRLLRRGRPAL